jgi:hypothetical protein
MQLSSLSVKVFLLPEPVFDMVLSEVFLIDIIANLCLPPGAEEYDLQCVSVLISNGYNPSSRPGFLSRKMEPLKETGSCRKRKRTKQPH